jgi:hypothetical protein
VVLRDMEVEEGSVAIEDVIGIGAHSPCCARGVQLGKEAKRQGRLALVLQVDQTSAAQLHPTMSASIRDSLAWTS